MKHTCVVRCKGCCSGSSGSNSGGGIGSSSRGREGVFVDANITTTVIDMKICYIKELCIMIILPNMLRTINKN